MTLKQKVRFGPFEVNLDTGELSKNGTRLKLQSQQLQILTALIEHPGELVPREALRQQLWPGHTFVEFEQSLNTAIKKLRQALCDEADTPTYIETLPKRGYRFISPVEVVPQGSQTPVTTSQVAKAKDVPRAYGRWRRIAVASTLLLLVSWLLFALLVPRQPRIVGTRQLTHTHLQKKYGIDYFCGLATDGIRVYFQERRRDGHWVLSQVSTAGGEATEIPAPQLPNSCTAGILADGSELLLADFPGPEYWVVSLPSGQAHRYNGKLEKYLVQNGLASIRASQKNKEDLPQDLWAAGSAAEKPPPLASAKEKQQALGRQGTFDRKLLFFFRGSTNANTLWATRRRSFPLLPFQPSSTLLYAGPLELVSAVPSKNSKVIYAIGVVRNGELSIYDSHTAAVAPFLNGISACFVTFSPDGQWVAYVSYPEGTLWKSRIDGTERTQLTFAPMGVLLPRWSPDGKFIVFMEWYVNEHQSIYIVPAEGGEARLLLSDTTQPSDPTWMPDSHHILFAGTWGLNAAAGSATSAVQILDLDTMQSSAVPGSESLWSPRISPDGKFIVALTNERLPRLKLYSFADRTWKLLPAGEGLSWPSWSHDSQSVFASTTSGTIVRVRLRDKQISVVANLAKVPWTAFRFGNVGWYDLAPDDRIVLLRDIGSEEIYALELDY